MQVLRHVVQVRDDTQKDEKRQGSADTQLDEVCVCVGCPHSEGACAVKALVLVLRHVVRVRDLKKERRKDKEVMTA